MRAFGRVALTAAVCIAVSIAWSMFVHASLYGAGLHRAFRYIFDYQPTAFNWIVSAFLTPVTETLFFLLVWLVWAKIIWRSPESRGRVFYGSFVVALSIFGFVVHGAGPLAISRLVCFGVLAALFSAVARDGGARQAFYATSAAHVLWNLTALLLIELF